MGVSLYTSRIILNTLGVVDFGVYNVVGGVVMMFSFLNSSMSTATQRFLSFEIGKQDHAQLKKVFSMSVNIHAIIGFVIFILAETVGLWFLNAKLNIPPERMEAANWVFQFSILTFIITIIGVPYNAAIVAHERMNVYAYVSIIEVTLKLIIVFVLGWFGFDRLKLYAILVFCLSVFVWAIYKIYCHRKFHETKYTFFWDKSLYKTLMNYASWNLFGAVAGIMSNQGINILLNLFFGPVVNASRAIAYQVSAAVNKFVGNFVIAVNPQIIKYYATGENQKMMNLVFLSSKYSYYLLFVIAMPIIMETDFILTLWLNQIPEYLIIFTRLIVITALLDSLSFPLMTAAQATGKIRKYQSVVGGMMLVNLPMSFCFLKLGFPPQSTMYIALCISFVCLFLRLWMLKNMVGLSIIDFFKVVVFRVMMVSFLAYIIPLFLYFQLHENILRFFILLSTGFITSILSIYKFGISANERSIIKKTLKKYVLKHNYPN